MENRLESARPRASPRLADVTTKAAWHLGPDEPRRGISTGDTFGALTVLTTRGRVEPGAVEWEARSACGRSVTVSSDELRTGTVRSCGESATREAAEALRSDNEWTVRG